jgi:hypothetical protein
VRSARAAGELDRLALKTHLEDKARVDLLTSNYPGPFAAAVRADYEAVHASLEGTRYTLAPDVLDCRKQGVPRRPCRRYSELCLPPIRIRRR